MKTAELRCMRDLLFVKGLVTLAREREREPGESLGRERELW